MISRKRSLANWIIRLANIIQTVPALAMLSILMLGMGLERQHGGCNGLPFILSYQSSRIRTLA